MTELSLEVPRVMDIITRTALQTENAQVYLVGGTVRDLLLKRNAPDLDVCIITQHPDMLLDTFRRIGPKVLILKGPRFTFRWFPEGVRWVDIQLEPSSLLDNLSRRDFTINAMACPWPVIDPINQVIDPLGGFKDLKEKRVRMVAPQAFEKDPVRVVRTYRLAAELDFHIEPKTRKLASQNACRLTGIAPERIAQELLKWLGTEEPGDSVRDAFDNGIWAFIIPELENLRGCAQGGYHHLDVWGHTLEVFKAIKTLYSSWQQGHYGLEVTNWGERESFTMGFSRLPFLRLAALLHDVGKPMVQKEKHPGLYVFHGHESVGSEMVVRLLQRLRFSRRAIIILSRIVKLHLLVLTLSKIHEPRRAAILAARKSGCLFPWLALLTHADQLGKQGPLVPSNRKDWFEQFHRYAAEMWFGEVDQHLLKFPLKGDDVIRASGTLVSGPELGYILQWLKKLWYRGRWDSPKEAMQLIASRFSPGSQRKNLS